MQLGSPDLTYNCSTMSPDNTFNFVIKRTRPRGTENSAGVGYWTLVSAGFFKLLYCFTSILFCIPITWTEMEWTVDWMLVTAGAGVSAESRIHEWESPRHWSSQHHHWICMYQQLQWHLTNTVCKYLYEYAQIKCWWSCRLCVSVCGIWLCIWYSEMATVLHWIDSLGQMLWSGLYKFARTQTGHKTSEWVLPSSSARKRLEKLSSIKVRNIFLQILM